MVKLDNTQFAVIGLGKFGFALARSLHEAGAEVLAVDEDQAAVHSIEPYCTHAVCIDAADEAHLKEIGIRNFDNVCVCTSGVEASAIITLTCKQMGIPRVICKAGSEIHKKVLEKIGADIVVFPEEFMGCKLASMLINPNMVELGELTPEFKIIEIVAPVKWENKTLRQLDLRKHYGISVLIIKRAHEVISDLNADVEVQDGDILVVCGHAGRIDKISKLLTEAVV